MATSFSLAVDSYLDETQSFLSALRWDGTRVGRKGWGSVGRRNRN